MNDIKEIINVFNVTEFNCFKATDFSRKSSTGKLFFHWSNTEIAIMFCVEPTKTKRGKKSHMENIKMNFYILIKSLQRLIKLYKWCIEEIPFVSISESYTNEQERCQHFYTYISFAICKPHFPPHLTTSASSSKPLPTNQIWYFTYLWSLLFFHKHFSGKKTFQRSL